LRLLAATLLLTLLLLPAAARAEVLTDDALDQTLAPIALYPDSLLGLVLVDKRPAPAHGMYVLTFEKP
jgi:hypothetical protein